MRKRFLCGMRSTLVIGAVIGLSMALAAGQAQATLLGPYLPDKIEKNGEMVYPTNHNEALMSSLLGFDVCLIDKAEWDEGGEFNLSDKISIEYLDPDPGETLGDGNYQGAELSWDFTGTGIEVYAVAVKDGVASHEGLKWIWYEVSNTDLDDQTVIGGGIVDTWANGQGQISNIALYGNSSPVPEPATVLLLGTGLVGLAGFKKKFKK